jgi:hypothetical protein
MVSLRPGGRHTPATQGGSEYFGNNNTVGHLEACEDGCGARTLYSAHDSDGRANAANRALDGPVPYVAFPERYHDSYYHGSASLCGLPIGMSFPPSWRSDDACGDGIVPGYADGVFGTLQRGYASLLPGMGQSGVPQIDGDGDGGGRSHAPMEIEDGRTSTRYDRPRFTFFAEPPSFSDIVKPRDVRTKRFGLKLKDVGHIDLQFIHQLTDELIASRHTMRLRQLVRPIATCTRSPEVLWSQE